MKSLIFAALVACAPSVGLAAHQDAKPVAPAVKTTPSAASAVGQWMLTMAGMPGGSISTLEFKLDPKDSKKLVGTLTSRNVGELPFKGTFSGGKLKFSIDIDTGGATLEVDFEGKLKDDDTLEGTAIIGMMNTDLSWTATRVKDK